MAKKKLKLEVNPLEGSLRVCIPGKGKKGKASCFKHYASFVSTKRPSKGKGKNKVVDTFKARKEDWDNIIVPAAVDAGFKQVGKRLVKGPGRGGKAPRQYTASQKNLSTARLVSGLSANKANVGSEANPGRARVIIGNMKSPTKAAVQKIVCGNVDKMAGKQGLNANVEKGAPIACDLFKTQGKVPKKKKK